MALSESLKSQEKWCVRKEEWDLEEKAQWGIITGDLDPVEWRHDAWGLPQIMILAGSEIGKLVCDSGFN